MELEKTTQKKIASELAMPDIASQAQVSVGGALDRVGMTSVEVPVRVLRLDGKEVVCSGRADAFVNLSDTQAKGIHMSRLYLSLVENLEAQPISQKLLKKIVHEFKASHKEISTTAHLKVSFDFMTNRKSLLSENIGWRFYPVCLEANLSSDSEVTFKMQVKVSYSSTCPCSAALARQLISQRFISDHIGKDNVSAQEVSKWLLKEESICATPHSQRSYATVDVALADVDDNDLGMDELILKIEDTLGTAVQAAVKREDEQEFARLNGRNLMFCEDAARKIKAALDKDTRITGYRIEAKHVESLHPHNAVSIVTK